MNIETHQTPAPKNTSAKVARNYSQASLKILFGMSGNQCAHPDCSEPIIASATDYSDAKVIGQIAHIYAHSDGGPRSIEGLTPAERDAASNLLLLCPTCHVKVDAQHETYPGAMLLTWKSQHEKKFSGKLTRAITDLGYAELEIAAKALLTTQLAPNCSSLKQIPPKDKLEKNRLGPSVAFLLTMGAAKSQECAEVIRKTAQLDEDFPDRLREGFVQRYAILKKSGYGGDELFLQMLDWAGASEGIEKPRGAAGLCMLTHLFILCDVFEK
ncbi:hypothetical protein [Ochrobactrum sp. AN78]|uniref:hypothetical protein n=1 Tax=Ochrobactrum sp. AN78 TaxID=3039853 RepID=UPI002989EF68|nr:hypothetical protein [Ochrobactrum sp. AN78]